MRTVSLQQICDIQIGKTPSRSVPEYWGGELPWVTISDFAAGRIVTMTKERITRIGATKSGSKRIPRGTLLLSFKLSLGKRTFSGCDLFTNEAIAALHVLDHDVADRDYLYWALGSIDYDRLVDRAAKGKTLNKAKLKLLEIPLPPLDEQKRIAGILDAADALRAKRREALGQLNTLLQSTFLDMFGDPVTNPMGWEQCVVGDVVHAAKDGPHVSPTYAESGVPFLSTRHIKPGEVVWEDLKYIDQDEANRQWKKCKPEFGDILYTKGGTTGIAARVTTFEPFAVWVHVALLKPILKKVHPIWIEAMLNSAYCYTQSQRYTHGIANRDLGLKRMVKIQMYLPPLAEQRGFAAVVASVEQQRARQRAHLAELDTLFASLQSHAFRGDH